MQYLQRPEGDVVSPGVRSYRKFLEEMTLNQRPEGSTEHVGTQVSDGDKSERKKTLKFQGRSVFLHRMKKHTF